MSTQNQPLSEIARQNLERNFELWKSESEYVRLEPGETRCLELIDWSSQFVAASFLCPSASFLHACFRGVLHFHT
jgi:hypothetical protein